MIIGTQKPLQEKSNDLFPSGSTSKHIQKLTQGGFMHVHRELDKIDANDQKTFAKHLKPNGLLIITGHGAATGSKVVTGAYDRIPNDPDRLPSDVPLDIACQGKDYVNLAMKSGQLKAGDHINILLHVCYGAKKSNELQKSFAQQLGDAFAKRGITTTIVGSETLVGRVDRFGTTQPGDVLGSRFKVRTEKEKLSIIETTIESNGKTRQTISKPNEDFYITSKAAGFLSDFTAMHEKKSFLSRVFKSNKKNNNVIVKPVEVIEHAPKNEKLQRRNAAQDLGKLIKGKLRDTAVVDLQQKIPPLNYIKINITADPDNIDKLIVTINNGSSVTQTKYTVQKDTDLKYIFLNQSNHGSSKIYSLQDIQKTFLDADTEEYHSRNTTSNVLRQLSSNDSNTDRSSAHRQSITTDPKMEFIQSVVNSSGKYENVAIKIQNNEILVEVSAIGVFVCERFLPVKMKDKWLLKLESTDQYLSPEGFHKTCLEYSNLGTSLTNSNLISEAISTLRTELGDSFVFSQDTDNKNQINITLPNNTVYSCVPTLDGNEIKFSDISGHWNKKEVVDYLREQTISPTTSSFKR